MMQRMLELHKLTAQNVQVQRDPQAVSDAQAAQILRLCRTTIQFQGTGALDLDDADSAAMQQALWQSKNSFWFSCI